MPKSSATKDIEKIVYETAKAMALAGNGVGTPRVVKLYIDDAREVLLGMARAAKRHEWTVDEIVHALEPPKLKHGAIQRDLGPLPFSSEP